MVNSPFTDVGRLEHEVNGLKHTISNKADGYEMRDLTNTVSNSNSEICSRMDSLEYSVRELSSQIDEFLIRLQEIEDTLNE